MSCRLFSLKLRPIWMVCAVGAVAAGTLHGADPVPVRRSIQFTEPKYNQVSTNVNELRGSASGLKNLEDDLARPLKSFNFDPEGSLDGVTAGPMRPPRIFSTQPRARSRNNPGRDWAFSTPEEVMGTQSSDDILNLSEFSENKDRENQSVFERYYERMFGTTNRLKGASGKRQSGREWDEWSGATNSTSENFGDGMQQSLKKLLDAAPNPEVFVPSVVPTSFGDLFKFNADRTSTAESLRLQKEQDARIESFKKIWDTSPAPAALPLPLPLPSGTPAWSGPGNTYSPTPRTPFGSYPGTINSSVSGVPATQPAVTPVPPAKTPPPREDFKIPRRPF